MEPEIAFCVQLSFEKSIRSEPENFRFELELVLWPKPSPKKCMRTQPAEIAFCIDLPSKKRIRVQPDIGFGFDNGMEKGLNFRPGDV